MPAQSTIRLSGSRTLELGAAGDRFLVVEEGCVELFLVWESEVAKGRRHHFASLPKGCWIFDVGFALDDKSVSVLAVGQAGTTVNALDLPDGHRIAETAPSEYRSCAAHLEDWITRIETGITEVIPNETPKTRLLAPGVTPAITAGGIVGSSGKPIWWKANAPGAMFYGINELNLELVPLAVDGWVACPQGAAVSSAFSSEELVTRGDWLDHIARAHHLFLRAVQAGVVARGERERETKERRSRVRDAAGEAAWQDIATVLAGEQEAVQPLVGSSSIRSLIFAFECAARRKGIIPQIPASLNVAEESHDVHDTLARMARKTSVRIRRVLLEGNWFGRNNGPLIGFFEESGEAVALLPDRKGRHILRKSDGSKMRVTAAIAQRLNPFAYCLYRSLPDRRLKMRDLIDFAIWDNGPDALTLGLMVVFTGLLGLVTPALTGGIFDLVIPQAERHLMAQIGASLVTAAFVRIMFEMVRGIALLRIQNRTDANLQAAVWDRLLKMPARFFRRYTAGDLATRAQGISEMHDALSSAGATALVALPTGLFNFIVMFRYNATLSLWGLGLALLALITSTALNAGQVFILRKQYAVQGKLAGLVFQIITGVAKFRIAGAEHLAFQTWATDYTRQERLSMRAGYWGVAARTFFGGYSLLTSLVIFAVVAHLTDKPLSAGENVAFTTGTFLAFNAAFGALVTSLITMGDSSLNLLQLVPLAERTKPIFDAEPEVAEDRASPGVLLGGVEIANVRFRYAEDVPPVLNNFSLSIEPAEFVALVGPSGSGKSTILRLLLGFEAPESGTILFDGKDLQSLDMREVRRQIGVVLQNASLVAGDIFRNIVGESSLTLDDAWRAAEMAGLAEDIRAMPMEMHTVVSEGGAGFSGGQRQRLAIARALAHNPRLLFFDEATSALDNRTQAIVTESLEKTQATRLVIAHRLSTIIRADRIVVLRDGRVVEDGKYADLMNQRGFFYELASRQLMEEQSLVAQ
jgi:NHLM bacteriocin system ABC transporter ATP-binding protein